MPLAPVGPDLRIARKAAGLTIDQLAVHAGIAPATVERIEHGYVKPRRATLVVLAAALSETSNAAAANSGVATTERGGARVDEA